MRIFLVVGLLVVGVAGIVRLSERGDPGAEAAGTASVTTLVAATAEPTSTAVASASSLLPPTTTAAITSTAPPGTLSPVLSSFCPGGHHAAVVDRDRQSAWLCEDGVAVYEFAFTGAISQPDPGTYPVYAKDLQSSSTSSAGTSTMTHFVAFTHGKFRGARIAFHSVPIWTSSGEWVQPLDSVGDLERRGESAGCLRVHPDDAVRVWDWLAEGDDVRVIT